MWTAHRTGVPSSHWAQCNLGSSTGLRSHWALRSSWSCCWLILQLRSHHLVRALFLTLVGLLLLLYWPIAQNQRFINQLTLNRETKHIYEVVLSEPRKDTLYIHKRPGQIAVLERGAVSVRRANRELKKYQKNPRQGLIQELVYLRRTDTDSVKDQ